jgi:hypothetical protein
MIAQIKALKTKDMQENFIVETESCIGNEYFSNKNVTLH